MFVFILSVLLVIFTSNMVICQMIQPDMPQVLQLNPGPPQAQQGLLPSLTQEDLANQALSLQSQTKFGQELTKLQQEQQVRLAQDIIQQNQQSQTTMAKLNGQMVPVAQFGQQILQQQQDQQAQQAAQQQAQLQQQAFDQQAQQQQMMMQQSQQFAAQQAGSIQQQAIANQQNALAAAQGGGIPPPGFGFPPPPPPPFFAGGIPPPPGFVYQNYYDPLSHRLVSRAVRAAIHANNVAAGLLPGVNLHQAVKAARRAARAVFHEAEIDSGIDADGVDSAVGSIDSATSAVTAGPLDQNDKSFLFHLFENNGDSAAEADKETEGEIDEAINSDDNTDAFELDESVPRSRVRDIWDAVAARFKRNQGNEAEIDEAINADYDNIDQDEYLPAHVHVQVNVNIDDGEETQSEHELYENNIIRRSQQRMQPESASEGELSSALNHPIIHKAGAFIHQMAANPATAVRICVTACQIAHTIAQHLPF
jgi:hypothetical protein